MARQTINLSEKNKRLISVLADKKGFKSENAYINYLISTHPEILEENIAEQKILQAREVLPDRENNTLSYDEPVKTNDAVQPKFFGETANSIKMRAKELNLGIAQYLILCHNKTMPIILNNDNIDALLIMQDYEDLKNIIYDESSAVINLLKSASSAVSSDVLSTVEDKQNNILNNLSDIKKIIKQLISEVENGYSQSVKSLKRYLKSHHIDSYILRKGGE
ncbi:MAG: hypothetical protein IJF98_08335 [Firmicutes bacterium]|nr:hypothetical protein [Bacillota bacterium]